ncbi:cell cycle checkpoint control protein RAD9A isoform X1 [Anastrepha ludens]|uniref:cell cycle checkpoint control protein RAD9A isoform X1 n=1 Tax=Anastrepha ludens TaxID=28586 RepID=UPI0023AF91A7|nr:cell cycle checkpoint control protein RAD9A isoform X1 [Anastrepha ludens]
MKCTLDDGSTKVFAKAVQSLSKFGGDLFVEANKDGMQLRTLNSTKSAVGTYRFSRSFFDCYEVILNEESYCKLDMRACLTVFRSTKQVERCDMTYLSDNAKFQIQLKCQHETLKNTFISVDEEENITAEMAPESTCNNIRGSHKIFTEISNNFNPAEEEITLEAQIKKISIKNYVEGSRVNEKFMRSQLQLNAEEFEDYKIGKETSITFCLKEFRAFLIFAEALNENVCLQFTEAGSPVFMGITYRDEIHCLLIMSTLSPEEISFTDSCQETDVQDNTMKKVHKRRLVNTKAISQSKSLKQDLQKCIAEESTLSNSSSLFNFERHSNKDSFSSFVAIPRNQGQPITAISGSDASMVLLPSVSGESDRSQTTHRQQNYASTGCETDITNMLRPISGDDVDCIPESPKRQERANLRTIFSRCFHSTYVPVEPSMGSQIYAPASDTED